MESRSGSFQGREVGIGAVDSARVEKSIEVITPGLWAIACFLYDSGGPPTTTIGTEKCKVVYV